VRGAQVASSGIAMRSTGDGTYCIDYTSGAVKTFS